MTSNSAAGAPLWLVEDEVRRLVSLNDAIDALADGLVLEARGQASNVDKALGQWDSSSLHALGSMMPERGYAAFKTWANTPNGAAAVVSLFSAADGRLLAVMEAAAIGGMRTAAISGLATRCLSDDTADEMALVGTGMQSAMQVAAVAAVRPLRRLKVFSPTRERLDAFVSRARAMFPFAIEAASSVGAAVADVPIVTTITRARSPFLSADMLAPGTHLNAPGAILPANAEMDEDVLRRADLVVVDSKTNAVKASREMIEHYGRDLSAWGDVRTLGEVLANGGRRPAGAALTVFKSMGMGLSDLAVAALVYERALKEGAGLSLPQGVRAAPRHTPLTTKVAA